MPIYEYKCTECESNYEKMQKVSDEPLTVCEKCGGRLEKQWSRSGFQFKGSGWYVTDYSNKGKSESKPETKGEATATNSAEKSSSGESTGATPSASNTMKSDTSSSGKESK